MLGRGTQVLRLVDAGAFELDAPAAPLMDRLFRRMTHEPIAKFVSSFPACFGRRSHKDLVMSEPYEARIVSSV